MTALKFTKWHARFRELFHLVGTDWDVPDELFSRLQEFTCFMYSSNPRTKDVNDLRYRLFCVKKGDLDSNQLPPCVDTLRKHCERANYQAAIWRRSLQSHPQIPSPAGHGWSLEEDRLLVNWMSGEPAPVAVLECYRAAVRGAASCQTVLVFQMVYNAQICVNLKTVTIVMRTQLRLSLTQVTRMKIDTYYNRYKNKASSCVNERPSHRN